MTKQYCCSLSSNQHPSKWRCPWSHSTRCGPIRLIGGRSTEMFIFSTIITCHNLWKIYSSAIMRKTIWLLWSRTRLNGVCIHRLLWSIWIQVRQSWEKGGIRSSTRFSTTLSASTCCTKASLTSVTSMNLSKESTGNTPTQSFPTSSSANPKP